MLTSERIKKAAIDAGADICGIGDLGLFDGAPADMDPRYIFPEAKYIIGLAFRIPRGVQRGIEEGTQFYQYPSMAYGGINEVFGPAVLYKLGQMIEDEGWEAVTYRNTGARGSVSDMDGSRGSTISPEEEIELKNRSVSFTRAVSGDRRAPDLQFSFRIAAYICGLGEIGWSKMFLTPQFGPMQRFAFILTDAPLEPDGIYDGPRLCRKCMACVRECPGSCISAKESVSITIGGKKIEWGALDEWKCFAFYTHTGRHQNPFVPAEVFDENKDNNLDLLLGKAKANEYEVIRVYKALDEYFPSWLGYNMVKCGGCLQACINQLEKEGGCLDGRFRKPLRRTKRWTLDR